LFYRVSVPLPQRSTDARRLAANDEREVTRAFTADRVRELTGLSKRQIQYWDEQDFIRPSLTSRQGRGRRRLYSFRDLVALRTAAEIRSAVSLQLIRKVDAYLRQLDYEHPMAEIAFEIVGDDLFFEEAGAVRHARRPQQTILRVTVPFAHLVNDLERRIAKLDRRAVGKLERRRSTLGGKLLIAGTRIPVATIQRMRDDGASVAAILKLFPDLRRRDVDAALAVPREETRRRRPAEAS
jgi:uncharacterized protein (DUF433 family)